MPELCSNVGGRTVTVAVQALDTDKHELGSHNVHAQVVREPQGAREVTVVTILAGYKLSVPVRPFGKGHPRTVGYIRILAEGGQEIGLIELEEPRRFARPGDYTIDTTIDTLSVEVHDT